MIFPEIHRFPIPEFKVSFHSWIHTSAVLQASATTLSDKYISLAEYKSAISKDAGVLSTISEFHKFPDSVAILPITHKEILYTKDLLRDNIITMLAINKENLTISITIKDPELNYLNIKTYALDTTVIKDKQQQIDIVYNTVLTFVSETLCNLDEHNLLSDDSSS